MREIKLFYASMESKIGRLYLARTEKGLRYVAFGQKNWLEFITRLKKQFKVTLLSEKAQFAGLKEQLSQYLAGRKTRFDNQLDLGDGTPFQKKVWAAMSRIPYGETRTYQWLAEQVKVNSPRAVGQACGSNPLPILIPCHRVVASDGTLGGYGGGLKIKRHLLKIEGALR